MCFKGLYCLTNFSRKFGRKEGNVLFNDALNTFYLQYWTYGKGLLK